MNNDEKKIINDGDDGDDEMEERKNNNRVCTNTMEQRDATHDDPSQLDVCIYT